MAHPLYHARASACRYGGSAADYLAAHEFMDQTKAGLADCSHRLILHNSWGIMIALRALGSTITLASTGAAQRLRPVLLDHVQEDLGRVPSLADCFPPGSDAALASLRAAPVAGTPMVAGAAYHAGCSAHRFGGLPSDYLALHEFVDSAVVDLPDGRHRLPTHNAWGCFLAAQVFGGTLRRVSDGREIPVRPVVEHHIVNELDRIPTLAECLAGIPVAGWMCRRASPLSARFGQGYNRTHERTYAVRRVDEEHDDVSPVD